MKITIEIDAPRDLLETICYNPGAAGYIETNMMRMVEEEIWTSIINVYKLMVVKDGPVN